jgi:hypothetical protein
MVLGERRTGTPRPYSGRLEVYRLMTGGVLGALMLLLVICFCFVAMTILDIGRKDRDREADLNKYFNDYFNRSSEKDT